MLLPLSACSVNNVAEHNDKGGGRLSEQPHISTNAKIVVSLCFCNFSNGKYSVNEKITAQNLARMKIGGRAKVFAFPTASSYESAKRNAYKIKQHRPRTDGGEYLIKCSAISMSVTVQVARKEGAP